MATLRRRFSTLLCPSRLAAVVAVLGLTVLTSGYSSCAGATGPLLVPLVVTPTEVLLRSSVASGNAAVGLARVDGGGTNEEYEITVEYGKVPPVPWLIVQVDGRNLTLRASPSGLDADATYIANVTIDGVNSGASGTLRVEFGVTK